MNNERKRYIVIDTDSAEIFQFLEGGRLDILLKWIENNFCPIKSINKNHTSYGLKHLIQSGINEYYANGEFKGAMMKKGI